MAIWLVRAGKGGEYEQKFLNDERVYLCWDGFSVDVSKLDTRESLLDEVQAKYPDAKVKTAENWRNQIWAFSKRMQPGDLVMMPLKTQPAIQVGTIAGEYEFDGNAVDPYFHHRKVDWRSEPVPKDHFSQDLLYSLGAFLTICQITRNNAEERIAAMQRNEWAAETIESAVSGTGATSDPDDTSATDVHALSNLEDVAKEQISRAIAARFKGHGLTKLVRAVLDAQGYSTYQSQEGPDGGADILAGAGPLGFESPRICVEVKSGDIAIDRPTVDQLIGAMHKFGASEGLFVSWAGFRSNVERELAQQFFRVRLWSRDTLIAQILEHYDKFDEEIKAELPLKSIWTLAVAESE